MAAAHTIRTKRVYAAPEEADGRRVLVDRLWPRGVTKARAHLDAWLREIAPSAELRRWFGHDPSRWSEFVRRYQKELTTPIRQKALASIAAFAADAPLTLVYAARDTAHNEAQVIADVLRSGRSNEPLDAGATDGTSTE